ncbi:Oidioi.mRNA.OKI2018_I69.chr2.g6779.t1.cds [Oikopleura dioica]|uniref:Oidioi.mRNA.OKI2018_I69.chr2.g6779.t1.cds n=1 Tax=Oikopleura dioica TaxID=34765 RepID=A0ABN7T435_OIKDI|nr:Oidioi.mRNA.OKI2018_I69.chr2.g6779.t1.cds [Oikopleura dioica]
MNIFGECSNCKCAGILRKCKGKVILVVRERPKADFSATKIFAKHGFSTKRQFVNYMIIGTIFWNLVVVTTNYIGLKKLTAHITYKSSYCNREYKSCVRTNRFDDCTKSLDHCIGYQQFIYPNATWSVENSTSNTASSETDKVDLVEYDDKQQEINLKNCKRFRNSQGV